MQHQQWGHITWGVMPVQIVNTYPRIVYQLDSKGNLCNPGMACKPVHLEALDMVLDMIVQHEQSPSEVI